MSYLQTGDTGPVSLMHLQKQQRARTQAATITIPKMDAPRISKNAQDLGELVAGVSFGDFAAGTTVRCEDFVSCTKIRRNLKLRNSKH